MEYWSTLLPHSGNKRAGLKNLCTIDMPIGVLIPPERRSCGYMTNKELHITLWCGIDISIKKVWLMSQL